VSDFGNLKDNADRYARQPPQEGTEGEQEAEKELGVRQRGGQQDQASQQTGSNTGNSQDQDGSGRHGQGQQAGEAARARDGRAVVPGSGEPEDPGRVAAQHRIEHASGQSEIADLGRTAVADAYGRDHAATEPCDPDAAIVNLYSPGARLGLHQDGEEPSSAPVVTISLGDTCVFRLAGVDRRTSPFTDVILESGDLLVFGGANRRIYHGVPKVRSGTAPDGLDLPPGRLSLTLRETGLTG